MSHCSLKPVAVVVFNNWRWNSSDVLCNDSVVGVPFFNELQQRNSQSGICLSDLVTCFTLLVCDVQNTLLLLVQVLWYMRLQTSLSSPTHVCGLQMQKAVAE